MNWNAPAEWIPKGGDLCLPKDVRSFGKRVTIYAYGFMGAGHPLFSDVDFPLPTDVPCMATGKVRRIGTTHYVEVHSPGLGFGWVQHFSLVPFLRDT